MELIKLHLGCGSCVKPGWLNLDRDAATGVIQHDLRTPLPYADGSVDVVYSEHFIEHVTREEASRLMRDCHRVMKSGAVIRISTPDLQTLVSAYQNQDTHFYKAVGWMPATSAQMMNEGMRLWEHMFLYDWREMNLLLEEAGFSDVTFPARMQGRVDATTNIDTRPDCKDLIAEAIKA